MAKSEDKRFKIAHSQYFGKDCLGLCKLFCVSEGKKLCMVESPGAQ